MPLPIHAIRGMFQYDHGDRLHDTTTLPADTIAIPRVMLPVRAAVHENQQFQWGDALRAMHSATVQEILYSCFEYLCSDLTVLTHAFPTALF